MTSSSLGPASAAASRHAAWPRRGRASACSSAGAASGRERLPRPARAGAGDALARAAATRAGMFDVRLMQRRRGHHRRGRRRRLARLRERPAARARRGVRARLAGGDRPPPRSIPGTTGPRKRSSRARRRADPGAAEGRARSPPPARRRRPRGRAAADRRPLRRGAPSTRSAASSSRAARTSARCDLGCPVLRQEHRRHHLHRARRGPRRRGPSAAPGQRIEPPRAAGGSWRVAFRDLGDGDDGSVEAPVVVLAAGTLGSSRLLLTNRRRLPGLSPALGTRFSGNGDALGDRLRPERAADVRGARNDYGPVMTSRLDYTAERGLIVADGGLPANFDVPARRRPRRRRDPRLAALRCCACASALVHARAGATRRCARATCGSQRAPRSDTDSLVFLMIGRDAADGRMRLTPLFAPLRHPLEQGRQRAAVRATSSGPRTSSRTRRRRDAVLRARGRPAGQVHDRPPARRLPDGRRPRARRGRRRRRASTAIPACTCSTARSSRPRSASTRRRRSRRWPSAAPRGWSEDARLSADLAQPHRRPGLPSARRSSAPAIAATSWSSSSRARRARGHDRARRRQPATRGPTSR